jgi:hypothetical protein
MLRRLIVAAALILLCGAASAATEGGAIPLPLPLFPPNNWWNTDISAAPLDGSSGAFIQFIGAAYPPTNDKALHPDFGGDAGGGDVYGFPFIQVDGNQLKKTVTFTDFGDQSDGVNHNTNQSFPFYPIPDQAITMNGWVEGGQPGNIDQRGNQDRHVLIVDTTNNTLYELYNVWFDGTNWEAASGAFFDMKTNNRRPDTWTSADASGMALLPGLVRYDEVNGPGEIRHAFRMTVRTSNGYCYPASHNAGSTAGALPMGARLRLKAGKDISTFPADIQKIFRAFKKYGLIVADNGTDMYISGTYDTRWDNGVLNPAFGALKASDFEVVQRGWAPSVSLVITIPSAAGAGDLATATVTAYDANYNLATGYRGTIHFTSSDGAATLPPDHTFTAGDSGTFTFTNGVILRTAGAQTITTTDNADATITGSQGVTVGPPAPTGLTATAATTTSVSLTWNPSPGATQYEVQRTAALAPYVTLVTTAGTSYSDNSATAGTTYVYKVRAIDASSRLSPFSVPDAATTIFFTNDPLVSDTTVIKAVHITELRQAVNAMRAAAGLTATSFTDSVLTHLPVKALHLQELRTSLGQARTALGLPTLTLTDPTLTATTTRIKAAHVQELRGGVK